MMASPLGIVVPTWQERSMLPGCLDGLTDAGLPVVVADGGSPDGSAGIAAGHPCRPTVLTRHGGRHRQLNGALERLDTTWVLVLPADARLLPDATSRIAAACPRLPGAAACLAMHPDERSWRHRLRGRWSACRSRFTGGAYLDQAPVFHRAASLAAGGFRACGPYDSADLGRRLRHLGPFAVIPEPVLISCREYRRLGFWGATRHHQGWRWQRFLSPIRLDDGACA